MSQLLKTWSGMCDVKWLLDRVVQLLGSRARFGTRPGGSGRRTGRLEAASEDGDGGIDDEAGARGTQPLGQRRE